MFAELSYRSLIGRLYEFNLMLWGKKNNQLRLMRSDLANTTTLEKDLDPCYPWGSKVKKF